MSVNPAGEPRDPDESERQKMRAVVGSDRIEEEIGRTVNYTLFEVEEWQERVTQGHSFLTDVLTHEKVFLIGDEDDLSALGTGGTD